MTPRSALLLLGLAALPAALSAGPLLRNREDDPEREKLEKAERTSQRGALSVSSAAGSHRAGRPFQGTGQTGPGSGREAIPVAETPYRPTTAGGSITSGGPIRTRYVSDCPNASLPCENVTPYQPEMSRILAGIKGALAKLKALSIQLLSQMPLAALAALGTALYLVVFPLIERILRFVGRTDQKAQGRLLAATARAIQIISERLRTGKKVTPGEIELGTRKAGEAARREIKDRLKPKE